MAVEKRKIGTRVYPPILVFIKDRCDERDSFSSRIIWDTVKEHYWWNPWGLRYKDAPFRCTPCQSETYPCGPVSEVARHYEAHEDFEESWFDPGLY